MRGGKCNSYANGNSYSYCYANANGDANSNCYTHGHANADANSNSGGNSDAHCNSDSDADRYTKSYSHSAASTYAGTSPIAGQVTSLPAVASREGGSQVTGSSRENLASFPLSGERRLLACHFRHLGEKLFKNSEPKFFAARWRAVGRLRTTTPKAFGVLPRIHERENPMIRVN